MTYALIFVTFLSAFVLLITNLCPSRYKKTVLVVVVSIFLVIGLIFQFIIEAKRKPNLISNYHEEINDFRDWKSEEAAYRILGDIKRLSRLGETTFDLNRCNLSGIHLKGLKMKNSNLNCIDLSNSHISDCSFENVNFSGANLAKATIVSSSFIN